MATNKSTKRKQASGGSPRSYSEIYKNSAAGVSAAPAATSGGASAATASSAPVVARTSDEVDWRGEYGYVIDDLKRLGIITGLIAGAIIIVGLFV